MSGYVSGRTSITSVQTGDIAADAVTSAKIADDVIDSEHYTDGSIDTAHIADDQITGAKLNPSLVVGDIIYADGTNTIARLAKGSNDEVLTLASGLPSWVAVSALTVSDTDTSNSGDVTLDFATNSNFILTFTGNVTLANPTTEAIGQSGIIICIQDGTGSRTLSLGTDYETAAGEGITLSTAANSVDIIPYFVQSASNILLGAVQKAFS